MTDSAPPNSERSRDFRWTAALGVVLLGAGLYALPSSIQAGDAGEFATVMLRGGVPHPSGYPWMRILGLVSRLLAAVGVPPVPAAAVVPMAAGVIGWMLLHRVALTLMAPDRRDGWAAGTAAFAVAACALSSPVLLHTADSEVWGPLVLFVGLLLWTAFVRRAGPLWVGLVFGLGLSHHLTAALLLPVCIAAAWPRPFSAPKLAVAAARGVAGGVVGLATYVTLMVGSDGAWRWGDTRTFAGLWAHVTRSEYGVLSLSLQNTEPEAIHQLARVGRSVGGALSAGLAPTALFGAAVVVIVMVLALRNRAAPLADRLGLVGAAVLSTWLFPLAHNIEPRSDYGAWILERFDILSLALLAPTLALAMARVPALLRGRGRVAVGIAVAAALLLVRQSLVTVWHGIPSDNPYVERYARDVLGTPPPGRAIILGTDDHRLFPITFAQEVLEDRPDVVYIDASLLSLPWYRDHLRRRVPDLPDVDKPVRLLATLWEDPAWREVPVYLTNDFSRPSRTLGRVPEGVLWRVIPPGMETSPTFRADRVLQRHRDALSRYGAPSREPLVAGHPFAADLRVTYTDTTAALAQALKAEGRIDDAEALLRFATNPPPPSSSE